VLDYYRAAGLLLDVDGDRPIVDVSERIVEALLPKFDVD
jgi:adenylate kinase family enzyme